jgi:hypothetical protein
MFVFASENYECRLLLDDVGSVDPGEQATIPIKFLRPDLIKPQLQIGDQFKLRESRVIAEGSIEDISISE